MLIEILVKRPEEPEYRTLIGLGRVDEHEAAVDRLADGMKFMVDLGNEIARFVGGEFFEMGSLCSGIVCNPRNDRRLVLRVAAVIEEPDEALVTSEVAG